MIAPPTHSSAAPPPPYAKGIGDDVNKVVWSLLAAEPSLTVLEIVQQYARYHFGSEHEATATEVIVGLERNWAGGPWAVWDWFLLSVW